MASDSSRRPVEKLTSLVGEYEQAVSDAKAGLP